MRTPPICTARYGSTPKVPHAYLDPPEGPPSIGQRPDCTAWRTDSLRAPRLALTGGIALAITITPVLAATVVAADPTVVVQPGDTLTGISRRHGVSVQRLTDLNDLSNPNRIFAGQRLRVGRDRSEPAGRTRAIGRTGDRRAPTVHVVSAGSTLWGIGQRYRVSVNAIVAANRIADPSRIFVGQRIVIPGASTPRHTGSRSPRAAASTPRPRARVIHVVTRGSTLSHIAVRYGVSVSSIAASQSDRRPEPDLRRPAARDPQDERLGLAGRRAREARGSAPDVSLDGEPGRPTRLDARQPRRGRPTTTACRGRSCSRWRGRSRAGSSTS